MSIRPTLLAPTSDTSAAGRLSRQPGTSVVTPATPAARPVGLRLVQRLGAAAVAVALAISTLTASPALGAGEAAAPDALRQTPPPRATDQDLPHDAYDGGYLPPDRQIIVPSIELGLTQDRPIPLGATCSCTIDRTGIVSTFDLTVIEVVQDASLMVQQLNRFNRPPRPGARYVAAYVGQQYIAGPENQAYMVSESDWKAAATDWRLSDAARLLHTTPEYRPQAEVYPTNYVNGWLYFELPIGRPAYLVWNYNFVGERGVWFALQ